MIDDPNDVDVPRVDLSSLDPFADARRANALVSSIVADGMAARRRRADGVIGEIGRWTRPMLVAAALVLAVSIPVAIRARPSSSDGATTSIPADTVERFGLPASVVGLVQAGRSPTPAEIVAAFNPRWIGSGR